MNTYTVHFLDVWGNEEDGYEVNNVYPSCGTIEIADDDDYPTIIQKLLDSGLVRPNVEVDSIECSGEDGMFFIDYDGKPVVELRIKEK